jgi:hypothetical protein
VRVLLVGALLAASVAWSQPISVAVLDWSGSGLEPAQMGSLSEAFSNRLSRAGASVSSPRTIAAVLGIERQRQLLGCAEASSCVAEIAGALGTEVIALGDVFKTSKSLRLSLKLIAAKDASILATYEGVASNDDELFALIDPAVEQLYPSAAAKLGRPAATKARSWWFVVPTAAGAAAGIGAIVTQSIAAQRFASIPMTSTSDPKNVEDVRQLRADGETAQWATRGLLLAGVAGLATGAVMFFTGFVSAAASPVVVIHADGALVALGVRL